MEKESAQNESSLVNDPQPRVRTLNHVSVPALDLDESIEFYESFLGLERIPSPTFAVPVAWFLLGDRELHLYVYGDEVPARTFIHHFALEVDDLKAFYHRATDRGVKETGFLSTIYVLPDSAVQMYVRDPAGNLVELVSRDSSGLDVSEIPELKVLSETIEQGPGSENAHLFNYLA
jgi:lactoylglutathione lyase